MMLALNARPVAGARGFDIGGTAIGGAMGGGQARVALQRLFGGFVEADGGGVRRQQQAEYSGDGLDLHGETSGWSAVGRMAAAIQEQMDDGGDVAFEIEAGAGNGSTPSSARCCGPALTISMNSTAVNSDSGQCRRPASLLAAEVVAEQFPAARRTVVVEAFGERREARHFGDHDAEQLAPVGVEKYGDEAAGEFGQGAGDVVIGLRRHPEAAHELGAAGFDDVAEQAFLAAEIAIKAGLGTADPAHHFLDARAFVAGFQEHLAGRRQQGVATPFAAHADSLRGIGTHRRRGAHFGRDCGLFDFGHGDRSE